MDHSVCAALVIALMVPWTIRAGKAEVRYCLSTPANDNMSTQRMEVDDIKTLRIPHHDQVCVMSLSFYNLSCISNGLFVNYSRLVKLSLFHNNIHTISAEVFVGLAALTSLNLSMNPIQQWNTSQLRDHTPQLSLVDLTGTSPWLPDAGVLRLKQLTRVTGVNWSQSCSNCSLVRSSNVSQLYTFANENYIKGYACRTQRYIPNHLLMGFAKHGFLATCVSSNQQCFDSVVKVVVKAPCRDTTLAVMYSQYVLGPLAMFLNMLIIIATICSKRLRKNFDIVLASNMAIGDFCNGLYSLIIVSVHVSRTFDQMAQFAEHYCAYIGVFWVFGVTMVVNFSFVLTIERYKSVISSRNRQTRMSYQALVTAMTLCWAWALATVVLPIFGVGSYSLNTYCISVFPVASIPVQFYYSIVVAGLSGVLYLATIPMYVKMYIFVRQSSKNMRVRADIELAKRVFSLVLTSLLLFLVPVIISLLFARVKRETSAISRQLSEVINSALPLVCLTLNSVCNPFLYAFRSRIFRRELSTFASLCSRKLQRKKTRPTTKLFNVRAAYVVQGITNNATLSVSM